MGTSFTIAIEHAADHDQESWALVATFEIGKAYEFALSALPIMEWPPRPPDGGHATLRCATCGGRGAFSTVNLGEGTFTPADVERLKVITPCSGCGSVEQVCAWYDVEGKKHATQDEANGVSPIVGEPPPAWRRSAVSWEIGRVVAELRELRGVISMAAALGWFARNGTVGNSNPGWHMLAASLAEMVDMRDQERGGEGEYRLVVLADQ